MLKIGDKVWVSRGQFGLPWTGEVVAVLRNRRVAVKADSDGNTYNVKTYSVSKEGV